MPSEKTEKKSWSRSKLSERGNLRRTVRRCREVVQELREQARQLEHEADRIDQSLNDG